MRRMMRPLLLALLIAGPISLLDTPAQATSIAQLSVPQLTDASTYIVRGTVTRVWTEPDAAGRVWTRAEIRVATVLKGPDSPATLIVDSMGGVHGDNVLVVNGMARFSVDEDVLLFLDSVQHGAKLTPVAAFAGKYTVRRAPHDDRPIVVQYDVNPLVQYDARFLPFPPVAERVYVDDLLDQVQARLGAGWDGKPIPGINAEKLRTINAPERRIR